MAKLYANCKFLRQEQERPDPTLKKPDLYMAAKENNTEYVLSLLDEDVPPTFIDKTNGWTVSVNSIAIDSFFMPLVCRRCIGLAKREM